MQIWHFHKHWVCCLNFDLILGTHEDYRILAIGHLFILDEWVDLKLSFRNKHLSFWLDFLAPQLELSPF